MQPNNYQVLIPCTGDLANLNEKSLKKSLLVKNGHGRKRKNHKNVARRSSPDSRSVPTAIRAGTPKQIAKKTTANHWPLAKPPCRQTSWFEDTRNPTVQL
jgi:hypothetical protein